MKFLSQLRTQLKENVKQLDEISLKTASSAFAKRAQKAKSEKNEREALKHFDKLDKSRKYITKRWGRHGVALAASQAALTEETKHIEESHAFSLPMVLLLRRKTIRNFSDGTQVALYYNDRLDKYFSIPVREGGLLPTDDPIGVNEDLQFDTNFDHIQALAEGLTEQSILFEEKEFQIDQETAQKLIETYTGLNEENKQKFLEGIDTLETFEKILTFCQNR